MATFTYATKPSLNRTKSTSSTASLHLLETAPASAPVLLEASGALAQVCGSLVEPEARRQQWSCHGCGYVFPRDATIYAAPNSAASNVLGDVSTTKINKRLFSNELEKSTRPEHQHYCKACYTARFSMGPCMACGQAVLGSTKEDGKFVKAGLEGHLWHGRCWACSRCKTIVDVNLGLDGQPTCEKCFDQPLLRKHVKPHQVQEGEQGSLSKATRPLSTSALSGSANRQKMGATIAELSRRLGTSTKPLTNLQKQPADENRETSASSSASGRHSRSPSRNGSLAGRARPLTAQFSGNKFDLAAFQPTAAPNLSRADSRSRSASPTKPTQMDETQTHPIQSSSAEVCSRCRKGALELADEEARDGVEMVSLQNGTVHYHAACFRCGVCDKRIDADNKKSFIRLDEERVAHPMCAPPALVERSFTVPDVDVSVGNCSASSLDHVTHQREPRQSVRQDKLVQHIPTSYLHGPAKKATTKCGEAEQSSFKSLPASESQNSRRFQSTAGAAPPTRSTLLQRQPADSTRQHAAASVAVGGRGPSIFVETTSPSQASSSSPSAASPLAGRFGRLGGMQACGGCGQTVSSLESVPGPRGQRWHRKCLVCSAPRNVSSLPLVSSRFGPPRKEVCGKALDSSAKVTEEGELRCRACYDGERARHPVRIR